MLEGIFVEGLIYAIMALGVFFTFRILDFPDLTVDGSFPMGAVIMATSLTGWDASADGTAPGLFRRCPGRIRHRGHP